MAKDKYREIDQDRMRALLDKHPDDVVGLLLALAWRAGLKSDELVELKWDQVDFENRSLRLKNRTVKMEDKLLERLQKEQERREGGDYVAVFPDSREPLSRATASRFLKKCLSNGGFPYITIADLRFDYARRTLSANGGESWRDCGMTAYEAKRVLGEQRWEQLAERQTEEELSTILEQVLQANRSNGIGIALWMTQKAGMSVEDVSRLTWDQIDLRKGVIHLDSGDVKILPEVKEVLRDEKERRKPEDDTHVVLSKSVRMPMAPSALIPRINALLEKNGLPVANMGALTLRDRIEKEKEQILQYAQEKGVISIGDVKRLLDSKPFTAYSRVGDLVEAGLLERSGRRYYPVGKVVPKERQPEAIIQYLEGHETATEKEVAEYLHISGAAAERLLRNMVASGKLVMIRQGKRYLLPKRPTV